MMKARKRNLTLSLIAILLVICGTILTFPALTLAEGDGSGGGQSVPLSLDASSPADGQKDVPLSGEIKLVFNKNVINLTIRDNNKNCFDFSTANGTKVPIEVIMADDQLYPEEKRNITVKPLQKLQPGTAYVVKISPKLQAKNGTSLGHEVTVNFVTIGAASQPVESTPVSDAGQEQANTIQSAPTTVEKNAAASSSEPNSPATVKVQTTEDKVQPAEDKSPTAEPVQDKQKSNTTYAMAAGLILLVILGYVYLRKRNRR